MTGLLPQDGQVGQRALWVLRPRRLLMPAARRPFDGKVRRLALKWCVKDSRAGLRLTSQFGRFAKWPLEQQGNLPCPRWRPMLLSADGTSRRQLPRRVASPQPMRRAMDRWRQRGFWPQAAKYCGAQMCTGKAAGRERLVEPRVEPRSPEWRRRMPSTASSESQIAEGGT